MSITKQLWKDNYDIALLSLNTKFVQGLKNGSLPKNIYQEYLAQDISFWRLLLRHMVLQFLNQKINTQ